MKNNQPTEDQEQIAVAQYLDLVAADKWFHVPNGGSRNVIEAVKLKRMGVKPGVPDIWVVIPRGKYCGLIIELKRTKGGVVSDDQKRWLSYLQSAGWYTCICKGFDPAVTIIEAYLRDML
jgi:hypothetical protein